MNRPFFHVLLFLASMIVAGSLLFGLSGCSKQEQAKPTKQPAKVANQPALTPQPPVNLPISVDFDNMALSSVAQFVTAQTGKGFILTGLESKPITWIESNMAKDKIFDSFTAALTASGLLLNPLGFTNLAEQWLKIKEQEVKPTSYESLERFILSASRFWGDRNIKEIGFAEIEDFLFSHSVSNKTKANIRSCLHTFWNWLLYRQVITSAQFPNFPVVKFTLGYRKIIDKDTQNAILDEVHRISYHINPRIWLGIKWLCTYIAIRPGELLKMQEQDFNTRIGAFIVRHTKEGKEKIVPMLEVDKKLINKLPVGLPELPFFRHVKRISGCRPGQPFGHKHLYKWWKKACDNLGIEGVDLYGGTRHSSATALKEHLSPEQIKAGTMHSTNKAFESIFSEIVKTQ